MEAATAERTVHDNGGDPAPEKGSKPRYVPGQERKQRTHEVEIPELGATFLLRAMTLRERTEFIAANADDDPAEMSKGERQRWTVEVSIRAIAKCLVEPELAEEELREEVQDWPPTAFDTLEEAAGEMIGTSEEVLRAAQTEFRDSDD